MGIRLNPQKFGAGFVKRKAGRVVTDFMEGMNKDKRGPERVRKLIETGTRMDSLIAPDKLKDYLELAKQYAWASSLISDNDIVAMLPAWVIAEVRAHGIQGWNWLRVQIDWLRSVFKD